VSGDPSRLTQVTRNLVGNAVKYSPRGATVRVGVERKDGAVLLRVSDEGPGISEENIPQLFLPFSRLAVTPTGGESSHGLGLSIAHDLVKLHGGTIRVESKPGAGATFIVEFPTQS
jgi:signal transduction histidine kinase